MKSILFVALLFSPFAFAKDLPARAESKTLDLPDFSNLQNSTAGSTSNSGISVSMDCKTDDGQSFKAGESGFDTCMMTKSGRKQ